MDGFWIFGYGSLMWDGWEKTFVCRRRVVATLHGFRRTFNKLSTWNWGTKKNPCPTLNVEKVEGATCQGMAFEFPRTREVAVRKYLQDREGEGFVFQHLPVHIEDGEKVNASVPIYEGTSVTPALSADQKSRMVKHAAGTNGSCRDYILQIASMLSALGIEDPAVSELAAAVKKP